LNGFDPETCRKNAVQRRRRAAALEMAEHATTRFFTGANRDFARDNFANAAQPKLATFHVAFHLLAVFQSRAFRSNYHSLKVTGLLQLLRSHQRAVAANNDQRSDPEVFQDRSGVRDDLCRNYCSITGAGLRNEMAAIGSTKNRSSEGHYSVYGLPIENDVIARR